MFASTTLFCLVTSLLAVLPSTIAVGAPAGEKVIFKVNTSSTATYCLYELGDLSLTVNACDDSPETMALVSTLGSAASTTPPVGTITHQYIPTTFLPRNGTYCLAANATTSTIVTINEGTKVIMKPCVSTDVTQQWAIRDGDGTIRLGNSNKCLTLKFGATVSSPQTLVIGTCAAGNVDQKWTPIPKPPSRGLTGYEPGSTGMAFYNLTSTSINCITVSINGVPMRLEKCSFNGNFITVEQNFTFVAGSSFVGKGAPGQIALWDGHCFDVLTKTSNGVSIDYLAPLPCNGSSLTQQWQVNNDSTVNLANTNKCIGPPTGTLNEVQVVNCIPGNVNQTWSILQVDSVL
ncbi:hypothetical protein B0H13DRAFT_1968952 [Mycena leptocephala]|nr:hypothetical protein B0H13DRAFT_1968952 [Mycena leptocephala]